MECLGMQSIHLRTLTAHFEAAALPGSAPDLHIACRTHHTISSRVPLLETPLLYAAPSHAVASMKHREMGMLHTGVRRETVGQGEPEAEREAQGRGSR
jgi:hypothetical protein